MNKENKMYSVKTFFWNAVTDLNSNTPARVRQVMSLVEGVNWKEAKKVRKENRGSWITFINK